MMLFAMDEEQRKRLHSILDEEAEAPETTPQADDAPDEETQRRLERLRRRYANWRTEDH